MTIARAVLCAALCSVAAVPVRAYEAALVSDITVGTSGFGDQLGPHSLEVSGSDQTSGAIGLVKFDLACLPSGASAAQIVSATLKVHVDFYDYSDGPDIISIFPITAGDWSEAAVPTVGTGTNQYTIDTTSSVAQDTLPGNPGSSSQAVVGSYITFDITAQVKKWVADPTTNHGLALKTFGSNVNVGFDSKENPDTSHAPSLDIELNGPPSLSVASISLPATTSKTSGLVTIAGIPFLHAYGTNNSYLGGGDTTSSNAGTIPETGTDNAGFGVDAMRGIQTGSDDVGAGESVLYTMYYGTDNVALGGVALESIQSGSHDVGIGTGALDATTGSNSLGIGEKAGNLVGTGSNNIDIGNYNRYANNSLNNDAGTIRLGLPGTSSAVFMAGIFGMTSSLGAPVLVNSSHQFGMLTSSRRFKDDICTMGSTSDVLMALQPVTYRYKAQIDPAGLPQFGLVAEDVAKVDRDLVSWDKDGKPYTVRYQAVNAMLLNEFLKEHQKGQSQEAEMQAEETKVQSQEAQLAAQQKELQSMESKLENIESQVHTEHP